MHHTQTVLIFLHSCFFPSTFSIPVLISFHYMSFVFLSFFSFSFLHFVKLIPQTPSLCQYHILSLLLPILLAPSTPSPKFLLLNTSNNSPSVTLFCSISFSMPHIPLKIYIFNPNISCCPRADPISPFRHLNGFKTLCVILFLCAQVPEKMSLCLLF